MNRFTYFDALKQSMNYLASDPKTLFLGQAVGYPGTAMTNTLVDISPDKKLEVPVFEDTQLGMSIGLAMEGFIPVSIFPRWNFFILASNQLINHLDKMTLMSDYRPGVIIRVGVGSERPLHPSFQHVGNFIKEYSTLAPRVLMCDLNDTHKIIHAYEQALGRARIGYSTLLVEYGDFYNEK